MTGFCLFFIAFVISLQIALPTTRPSAFLRDFIVFSVIPNPITTFFDLLRFLIFEYSLSIFFGERKDLGNKIGTLLSILLKKNSVINSEENETSENSQSLTKAAS